MCLSRRFCCATYCGAALFCAFAWGGDCYRAIYRLCLYLWGKERGAGGGGIFPTSPTCFRLFPDGAYFVPRLLSPARLALWLFGRLCEKPRLRSLVAYRFGVCLHRLFYHAGQYHHSPLVCVYKRSGAGILFSVAQHHALAGWLYGGDGCIPVFAFREGVSPCEVLMAHLKRGNF